MEFKSWFFLYESVEANLKNWLGAWSTYLEKNDMDTLKEAQPILDAILTNVSKQEMIIKVLTKTEAAGRNHNNQNFLRYLIGFATTKPNFRVEDLQRAIDAVDWMLQTNKLTKTQASTTGWYQIGKKAPEYIRDKQNADIESASPSNTKISKMKKTGEAFDELTPVVKEGQFTLYLVKGVDSKDKKEISKKHMLLCKYGKDTSWCTADPTGTYHEQYAKNDIFILYKNNIPTYQFARHQNDVDDDTLQFKDVNDDDVVVVDFPTFNFLRKYNPDEFYLYTIIPYLTTDEADKIDYKTKKIIYNNYALWYDRKVSYDPESWEEELAKARKTIASITKNINDFEKFVVLFNPDDDETYEEMLSINPKFIKYIKKLDILNSDD